MCVIYLFAGLSKLAGPSWWDGSAIWLSFANLEYQSLDMTWMAAYPLVISFMTHLSVMWEVSYAALIWPRLTRPIWVALAIPLHLGIAICLGMITFGLIMLVGNMAFIEPSETRWAMGGLGRLFGRRSAATSAGASAGQPVGGSTARVASSAVPPMRARAGGANPYSEPAGRPLGAASPLRTAPDPTATRPGSR